MIPLSPASAVVECAGERHRLHWRDGRLMADDHPDAERERALTALGGDAYRCLELQRLWEQHTDDLDILLLSRRGPGERPSRADDRHYPGMRHGKRFGWTSYSPLSSTMPPRPAVGLRDVLRLGGGLPDRLAAQVIYAWTKRIADGDDSVGSARPQLHAALYGRFATAARDWLGAPEVRIDLAMVEPGTAPALSMDRNRLQVQLPFSWLADVWLPGFTIVAERICLAASRPRPDRFDLSTVDRSLTNPATITLEVHEP